VQDWNPERPRSIPSRGSRIGERVCRLFGSSRRSAGLPDEARSRVLSPWATCFVSKGTRFGHLGAEGRRHAGWITCHPRKGSVHAELTPAALAGEPVTPSTRSTAATTPPFPTSPRLCVRATVGRSCSPCGHTGAGALGSSHRLDGPSGQARAWPMCLPKPVPGRTSCTSASLPQT
jgi:hypothetical protein